jgi:hypothetical protein
MKAGTTSLYTYLSQHPRFAAPAEKELHFFDNNFQRGSAWYRSRFPLRPWMTLRFGQGLVSGEASPYYLFHPLAPRRARNLCPRARIIILVRNPVDRAYSHYQQNVRAGFETLPFEAALHAEPSRLRGEEERLLRDERYYSAAHQTFSYLARGEYAPQIARWIECFGHDGVLVLGSEAMRANPPETYTRVLDFLGLPPCTPRSFREQNTGRYGQLDPALRRRLADHFRAANQRLFAMLGHRFEWEEDPDEAEPHVAEAGRVRATSQASL